MLVTLSHSVRYISEPSFTFKVTEGFTDAHRSEPLANLNPQEEEEPTDAERTEVEFRELSAEPVWTQLPLHEKHNIPLLDSPS